MNLGEIISLLAMGGTVAAAIATYLNVRLTRETLNVQKKEGETLRKPYILVDSIKMDFSLNEAEIEDWHESITVNDKDIDFIDGIFPIIEELKFPIINIHKGVAKNVEIKTFIKNIKDYKGSDLNDIFYKHYDKFEIDYYNEGKDSLVLNYDFSGDTGTNYMGFQTSQKHLFIDTKENAYKLEIPSGYVFLLALHSLGYYCGNDKIPAPILQIEIKCTDINDKEYQFDYIINIDNYSWTYGLDDEPLKISPNLSVSKMDKNRIQSKKSGSKGKINTLKLLSVFTVIGVFTFLSYVSSKCKVNFLQDFSMFNITFSVGIGAVILGAITLLSNSELIDERKKIVNFICTEFPTFILLNFLVLAISHANFPNQFIYNFIMAIAQIACTLYIIYKLIVLFKLITKRI